MDFSESIKEFAKKARKIKDSIGTEEATKMSLVVPLFQLLGYDVFNPQEFCPEYTADVGIKKGERVDYAIQINGEPVILIECKACTEDLDKHGSQLFRYFATSTARFGILTNGIIYRFFTDIVETNKMDLDPFLEINLFNLKENQITELRKFHKDHFDSDSIFGSAEELKYSKLVKDTIQDELENPSPDFVKFAISRFYAGKNTQKVLDFFTPIVKKAVNTLINDAVNQKLSTALDTTTEEAKREEETPAISESKIVTTEEEIEAFLIVRAILAEIVSIDRIVYRDTESYFGILFDDNNRKPICRINFDRREPWVMIPENGEFKKYPLSMPSDLYKYKKQLESSVQSYL